MPPSPRDFRVLSRVTQLATNPIPPSWFLCPLMTYFLRGKSCLERSVAGQDDDTFSYLCWEQILACLEVNEHMCSLVSSEQPASSESLTAALFVLTILPPSHMSDVSPVQMKEHRDKYLPAPSVKDSSILFTVGSF